MYVTSGSGDDWFRGAVGLKWAFLLELPDKVIANAMFLLNILNMRLFFINAKGIRIPAASKWNSLDVEQRSQRNKGGFEGHFNLPTATTAFGLSTLISDVNLCTTF